MINDMQFKMKGKKRSYSFWSWVLKKAQRKVKETEEKTVNLISVNFPSAFCMLIRYEIINTGQKYEIVMQGDYQDQYRSWKESEEKEIPEAVKVEWIITENHANAKQVVAKSIM
jgi:hypothetical protein